MNEFHVQHSPQVNLPSSGTELGFALYTISHLQLLRDLSDEIEQHGTTTAV
jgi:hypothetical protein